jgi:hypothetical protein
VNLWLALPKALSGERVTRTRLQVLLEAESFGLVGKRNVSHELPRFELRRVLGGTCVVMRQSLLQVSGNADIALTRR